MSLCGKSVDLQTNHQKQLSINIPYKDEKETRTHRIHENTAKVEDNDKNKRTPDGSTIGSRIIQILNSVHKKAATPDYTRISHHRTCQQTSCRSLRFTNKEPPRGPFL
ncbi:hypothetical protein DINM_006048 [Dirofilaria immitis]|nr:hypothetical protein [Dirofilaria immitis]